MKFQTSRTELTAHSPTGCPKGQTNIFDCTNLCMQLVKSTQQGTYNLSYVFSLVKLLIFFYYWPSTRLCVHEWFGLVQVLGLS